MQVETQEDETTLEQLRALKRVFVPQKVQDDFMEVSGRTAAASVLCLWTTPLLHQTEGEHGVETLALLHIVSG